MFCDYFFSQFDLLQAAISNFFPKNTKPSINANVVGKYFAWKSIKQQKGLRAQSIAKKRLHWIDEDIQSGTVRQANMSGDAYTRAFPLFMRYQTDLCLWTCLNLNLIINSKTKQTFNSCVDGMQHVCQPAYAKPHKVYTQRIHQLISLPFTFNLRHAYQKMLFNFDSVSLGRCMHKEKNWTNKKHEPKVKFVQKI